MQGFILKATASSHPKRAGCAAPQADAGRVPNGSTFNGKFNGKRVSSHPSYRTAASTPDDGKHLENAFWNNRQLQRRKITPADVLTAYRKDTTSLRGGFFLQKLCLQHILHDNRKVTPDQVIQEFNRVPDRYNKYKLAIARFKAECCLRGLSLNRQQVTPDMVVKAFPDSPEGKLGITRFQEQCCLKDLPLGGQQVTPGMVVKGYQGARAILELARFKEQCCLRGLPLNGRLVTPDSVVRSFPDSPQGKLGVARFKERCCLRGMPLDGQQVTPEAVIKGFQDSPEDKLGIMRFKEECCLRNLPLNGQRVTPEAVVKGLQAAWAILELARFKAECCLRGLTLNGQPVTPDSVVKSFPDSHEGKLGIALFEQQYCLSGMFLNDQQVTPEAVLRNFPDSPEGKLGIVRFMGQCCLNGLLLNGQKVTPDAVLKNFPDSPEGKLGIARFKAECCLRGLRLAGQLVPPDAVAKDFQAARVPLELARFKQECCFRGLLLNGQQVTPDAVARSFPGSREGKLGRAHFKEQCCLKGLLLNGQQVTPDAVVKDYPDSPDGKLGIARFREECCLRRLELNSQQVTPDAVAQDFQAIKATLELARFKAECCLRGLELNGQQVTPDAVVRDFPDSPEGKLGIARFKEECCLRGLPLSGKQIKPDTVVRHYQETRAKLEIARFKAECCLRGLPLNGQQVTPGEVVKDFQAARATLERARFKAECCLRELPLNGQPVTPDAVVKDYPDSPEGKLGIARFKEQCCLKSLPLNGQLITPDAVVKEFPDSPEGKLGIARFKEQCCLKGLPLNGRLITPEAVALDYQEANATLELVRFRAECCLRGLTLNGQQVTPESVVKDYERGGWLLERAIFYSLLSLSATELNGNYLDNRDILNAFNEAPGNHSARQARYLIQKVKQPQWYDETDEAQDLLQEAWQILNNVLVKDEEHYRLQSILTFMAMNHELTIDHQRVSAEQVLRSINILRPSFQNLRIHFFFLAHCYITNQPVHGQQIHKVEVLGCLQGFPEGSKLRHGLGCWLEIWSSEANIMDELLFTRESDVYGHRNRLPDVVPDSESTGRRAKPVKVSAVSPDMESPFPCQVNRNKTKNSPVTQAVTDCTAQTLKRWSKTGEQGFPDEQVPRLNALTLKTLEIIQEINGTYSTPPLLITGSFARFLQHLCTTFKDIDIICMTEESARTLFAKLQALNTNQDSEIPKTIIIWPIPGCQAIRLPKAYNIQLKDGDLGTKTMGFQVSIDARLTCENAARLAVQVPGVERPVWHLSFAEETQLLNDTLQHLVDNLDPLTEQLLNGAVFDLPRTILFNKPQNNGERIYGLLIRSLLTLNKARHFIALHSQGKTGKPDCQSNQLQREQQRLHALTRNLQMKLHSHVCRNDFEYRVSSWLSANQHVNDYQARRKAFIEVLLAMMHPQ